MFRTVLVLIWLGVAGAALLNGLEYYTLPLPDRAFSGLHDVYAPSGSTGLDLGIAGTVMIVVGVLLYGLRKRLRVLQGTGSLKHWLQFHIFLCTLGPFLVLLHTSFKFGGIISIAFWSMTLVVLSGVFGRYVYVRIPKTIQGQFLSISALDEQRDAMIAEAGKNAGVDPDRLRGIISPTGLTRPKSTLHALRLAIAHDLSRRAQIHRVKSALGRLSIPPDSRSRLLELAKAQLRLQQQVALLQPFQRLFRYWHVFHLPLAVLMLLILSIHVGVAVMFGYAWSGG